MKNTREGRRGPNNSRTKSTSAKNAGKRPENPPQATSALKVLDYKVLPPAKAADKKTVNIGPKRGLNDNEEGPLCGKFLHGKATGTTGRAAWDWGRAQTCTAASRWGAGSPPVGPLLWAIIKILGVCIRQLLGMNRHWASLHTSHDPPLRFTRSSAAPRPRCVHQRSGGPCFGLFSKFSNARTARQPKKPSCPGGPILIGRFEKRLPQTITQPYPNSAQLVVKEKWEFRYGAGLLDSGLAFRPVRDPWAPSAAANLQLCGGADPQVSSKGKQAANAVRLHGRPAMAIPDNFNRAFRNHGVRKIEIRLKPGLVIFKRPCYKQGEIAQRVGPKKIRALPVSSWPTRNAHAAKQASVRSRR